jgi:hypothetical protein
MLVLILRPLASVGLAAAFTTTSLHAADASAERAVNQVGQTQTQRVSDHKAKAAEAAKTRAAAKRTIGKDPAMPLWEGPWGPHH